MNNNEIEIFRKNLIIAEENFETKRLKHNSTIGVAREIKEILEEYKENNGYIEECQGDVKTAMDAYKYVLDELLQDSLKLEKIIEILRCKQEVKKSYEDEEYEQ